MAPKPRPSSPEEEDRKSRHESHSSSSKMKSAATSSSTSKTPSKQPISTQSPRPSTFSRELPIRGGQPAKPLNPREIQDLREHKARLEQDAKRKKSAEETAWMRRAGIDPATGEKVKPKSTGSSSSDSPIRRVESPEPYPAHWTEEEKLNHERLIKEGIRAATHEPHRLNKDKIVRHKDYVTIAWDSCKNVDVPWYRFKTSGSGVSPSSS